MSAIDGPVLAVSPDGTMIDLDGMILSVSSSSTPPKGTVYLPNPSIIEGDLVLPNDGHATSLPIGIFMGQTSLTGMLLPNSLAIIGVGAFYGCKALTNVNIPDSVTSIGNETFNGCTSLTSVNIPDSVTSIGNYAFYNCSSLESITIPDSVTSIEDSAF
jgi:hypothetical protein